MRAAAVLSFALWIGLSSAGRCENAPPLPQPENASPAGGEKAALNDDLLKQKVAELERLQAEVQELRRAAGQFQKILVHLQVVELSLTKLRNLGVELPRLGLDTSTSKLLSSLTPNSADDKPNTSVTLQIGKRESIAGLIKALRQEGIAKILAEPTIITVDRRPASIHCGGEIPVPITNPDGSKEMQQRPFGTEVHLTATLLGGGKVRVEARYRISELDYSHSVTADGATIPGFRVREMDTGIEMDLGKTSVLGGLIQQQMVKTIQPEAKEESNVRDDVQVLFLMTPELAD